MGKPYSLDLRKRVVAAVLTGGMSRNQAAQHFGVGISTAINGVKRQQETGSVAAGKMRENDQCDLASSDYERAIELDSEATQSYLGRALCLGEANDAEKANKDLDRVIKLDNGNAAGYALMALNAKAQMGFQEGESRWSPRELRCRHLARSKTRFIVCQPRHRLGGQNGPSKSVGGF
jgi:transposase-like protein